LGAKKGKGGGYYLKEPKDINILKSIILEGPIALLPCASHNFMKMRTVQMKLPVQCKPMAEVRDNTLQILKIILADIAFSHSASKLNSNNIKANFIVDVMKFFSAYRNLLF
jgi:DNA-binding IscR family transcriptional regulator